MVFSGGQFEVLPRVMEFLGRGIEIENGQVISFPLGGAGKPDGGFVRGTNGVISGGVLIHGDDFGVG